MAPIAAIWASKSSFEIPPPPPQPAARAEATTTGASRTRSFMDPPLRVSDRASRRASAAQSTHGSGRLRGRVGPVAVEGQVAAAAGEQLVVRALLDDRGRARARRSGRRRRIVERRCAITKAVRPASSRPERLLDPPLGGDVDARGRLVEDRGSADRRAARARTRRAGAGRARAARRARRPRCRSRRGARRRTSSAPTALAAATTSSSVASGRAKAMFSRIVPENRKPSCGTMPSWRRRLSCVTSRRSCPSIVIRPSRGS